MISRLRQLLFFTSLAGICFSQLSTKPLSALFEPNRFAGQDRFETAVFIGNRINTGIRDIVYLTRSDRFADALAAGSLYDGPLLLVPPCGSTRATLSDAIERWNPKKVVAIGGESAVCEKTLIALANGRPTSRISGEDRIRTAIAISQYRYPIGSPQEIYLATSRDSPDALAIALSDRGPILLVGNQDPPTWLIDEVSRLASEKIVVIGGQQVLPDHVINKLTGNKPFTRLAGNNRYETAVEISKYLYPEEKPQDVYLARGDTYVDAVAAGMASRNVLLLVPRCGPIPSVVKAEVQRLRPENVIALGGEAAICNQVLEELTRDQGSGGHGIANPRTAYLWQSTSQLLRLALEVPDSNNVYWVWYHTDACSLLGYLSSDECDSDTESQAVWSLTEEISVDGGATACWTRRSENDWGQERVVDVAYLPSRAVGIYRIMYATRSWFDPCGSASPSSTPFPTTVRATFVNHVAGTEEVSPWITINPVDF